MKKVICIILCISAMLAFASCKKGGEEATTSATSQTEVSTTTAENATTAATTQKQTTTETTTKKTTQKTTTPMPSTKASEAVPITVNEALDRLSNFYGSAYNVNATVKEGDIQYFKITDKKENLYARVEVNLKTSDAKETIEHSGEVNVFNLSV